MHIATICTCIYDIIILIKSINLFFFSSHWRSHHNCCFKDACPTWKTTTQQIRHVCYCICRQLFFPIRPLFKGYYAGIFFFWKSKYWSPNTWTNCSLGTCGLLIQTSSWKALFQWCYVWNDSWSLRIQVTVLLLAV